MEDILIAIHKLRVHFPVLSPFLRRVVGKIRAVDGVSFSIPKGKTLALVGESGSGKTTLGRVLVGLQRATSGSVRYEDKEITELRSKEFFPFRRKIQMVFQDPYSSLNPKMRVQSIIEEPLEIHFPQMSPKARRERVVDLLTKVGLAPSHINRYPHEFSGGQRQRIGIARSLAVDPECIVCDEAVSALDVSIQAQILKLLQDLQVEIGLTYLFITHDLAIVQQISDFVVVMHQGKVVEQGNTRDVYNNPGTWWQGWSLPSCWECCGNAQLGKAHSWP